MEINVVGSKIERAKIKVVGVGGGGGNAVIPVSYTHLTLPTTPYV